jgi:hypothetical protein
MLDRQVQDEEGDGSAGCSDATPYPSEGRGFVGFSQPTTPQVPRQSENESNVLYTRLRSTSSVFDRSVHIAQER